MPAPRVQRAARKEALVRAAIEVMVEQGLTASRIADIAARAGISPGHVLYYFESKDDLFLQALATVERDLRDDVLERTASLATGAERFRLLLDAAAPTGPGDVRLLLWLEAWELAPRDAHVARQVREMEDDWLALLTGVLRHGLDRGEFATADLDGFALRFSALLDGLTIQVVTGSRRLDRDGLLAICRDVARRDLGWTAL